MQASRHGIEVFLSQRRLVVIVNGLVADEGHKSDIP